jgi:hypothetical protein
MDVKNPSVAGSVSVCQISAYPTCHTSLPHAFAHTGHAKPAARSEIPTNGCLYSKSSSVISRNSLPMYFDRALLAVASHQ